MKLRQRSSQVGKRIQIALQILEGNEKFLSNIFLFQKKRFRIIFFRCCIFADHSARTKGVQNNGLNFFSLSFKELRAEKCVRNWQEIEENLLKLKKLKISLQNHQIFNTIFKIPSKYLRQCLFTRRLIRHKSLSANSSQRLNKIYLKKSKS